MSVEFIISLNDKVSGPASMIVKSTKSAADALDVLKRRMAALESQKVLAAASGDIDKVSKLNSQLKQLSASSAAVSKQTGLADQIKSIGSDAKEAWVAVEGLALALAAVAVAGAAVIGAGAAFAIAAASFKEESITAIKALTDVGDGAEELYNSINAIADKTAVPLARLQESFQSLLTEGFSKEKAFEATENIGIAYGALGEKAAAGVQKIYARAAEGTFTINAKMAATAGVSLQLVYQKIAKNTGMSIAQVQHAIKKGTLDVNKGLAGLDDAIKEKLGPLALAKMNDLGSQMTRFHNLATELFQGIGDSPGFKMFEAMVKRFVDLFDQNTKMGKAFRALITSVFSTIFTWVAKLYPIVEKFFLIMYIRILQVYIALRPIIERFKQFFGGMGDHIDIVEVLADVIAGLVTAIVIGVGVIIGVQALLIKGWNLVVDAVKSVVDWTISSQAKLMEGWNIVIGAIKELLAWFANLGAAAAQLASDIIDGLVNGLNKGVDAIKNAAKNVAHSAIDAIGNVFKFGSPSKEMERLGGLASEGFSIGLDKGAPKVGANVSDMMAAPPQAPTGGGGGGGITISPGAIEININGVKDAESLMDVLPIAIAQAFEQLAMEMGT